MKSTQRYPRTPLRTKWLFIALFGLLSAPLGYGQQERLTEPMVRDSTPPAEIIPFNEVLIASGESRIRAIRMSESLISPATIEGEARRNDSLLVLIDSALSRAGDPDYSQKSQRFLFNEKNYWQIAEKRVKSQKKRLSDLIRILQDRHATVQEDLLVWKNTQRLKDSSYTYGNMSEVIASTIGMLDSLTAEIDQRTELLISPLNKTIRTEVELELLLEKIQQALNQKTTLALSKTSPALFDLDGSNQAGRGLPERVHANLKSEWNALVFYMAQERNTFVVYVVFLVLVLVLFYWISTRLGLLRTDNLSYYENTFRTVLRRPFSAGILFSLFFTLVFFPNRPPLLVDITVLVLLLPLLDIFLKLTPNSVHRYLVGFIVLLVILQGIRLLPEETMYYRYSLLGLGLAEFLILLRLFKRPELVRLPSSMLTRFVRFLIIFHLVAVVVGLIANALGYVGFSQVAIASFITNTLVGLLLYVCAIILIGGLQFFVSSSYLDRLQAARDHEEYLKGAILRVVIAGVILFWLVSILRIFYLKDPVYAAVERIFTQDLSLGSMSFSLGNIVLFFFILWFSITLSRVIKIVLRADVLDKLPLKKGVPRMVTAITQTALITFGVLFAIRAIGMPMDQLTIIFSAFSVGIGFGLQNIFNNLVSGIILLFERPVQIGDTVEVGNLIGKVQSMGIRSSNIHTFDGAEVIVPNGQLISQEVVNWTLSDKTRRIEVISGVAYGSDVHLVRNLLLQVLQEHPEVIPSPAPMVLFNAMAESSLDFRLLFWTDHFDEWLRIRSEVLFAIHDILYANNITIPFPQRDLHLKSVDPSVFRNQGENTPGSAREKD